jgi:hypothetical protein
MHNCARGQGYIGATVPASDHPQSRCDALSLVIDAACGARESAPATESSQDSLHTPFRWEISFET